MRTVTLFSSIVLLSTVAATAQMSPRLSDALDLQRALAAQNPGNAEVLNDLGNLYGLAGNYAEAEAAYRQAIGSDPSHSAAHYNLALTLQESEQLEEATLAMEQAATLDPGNARVLYQLGNIYMQRGERAAAIDAFGRSFRVDPSLALSTVNPQVIDNPLLTEAMLVAYKQRSRAAMAPRAYDQPEKITDLLVPERELLAEKAEDESEPEPAPEPRQLVTPKKPMFKPPPPTEEEKRKAQEAPTTTKVFGGSDDVDGWGDSGDAWGDAAEAQTWENLEAASEAAREQRIEQRREQRQKLRELARQRAAESAAASGSDNDGDGTSDER